VRQWRLREAEQHCAQALPLFADMPQVQHFFTGVLAQCAVQRGQLAEGCARTWPALEALTGPPRVTHWSLLHAEGLARSRMGEASGRTTLARCFELSLAVGLPHYVLPAGCAMAEALALAGREDDARAALLQAWSRRGHDDSPWTLGLAAVWAQRLKTELPQEPGRPVPQVAEVFLRELQGDHAAAAALWHASDAPFEEGLCLMHCGDDGLRQALDIFSRIGAQPAARLARAEARRRGVKGMKRGPYAAARRNDLLFTKRELQVLGLLAEGQSNAQIAATLSRSERTVEHHVAKLLAKAGADNRRSLLAMASRSGVLAVGPGA
jgi:DNA-binding CsgD family transcriptional regulator